MNGTRKGIPRLTEKRLMQECGGKCPFCNERDAGTFQCHHIDGDRSNSDYDNLIEVCASCHARITNGTIEAADVKIRKWELQKGIQMENPRGSETPAEIHQTAVGSGIVQVAGDYAPNKRTVLRPNVHPTDDCISSETAYLVRKSVEDLAANDPALELKKAYSKWYDRIRKRYRVVSYRAVPREMGDDLLCWLTRMKALQTRRLRRGSPDAWRRRRYTAIWARSRQLGLSKSQVYELALQICGLSSLPSSLKDLPDADIERVYDALLKR